MRIFKGTVQRVGEGIVNRYGVNNISIIQIDNQIVQNVSVCQSISSFLDIGEYVTLYFTGSKRKNLILALQHSDGTKIMINFSALIDEFLYSVIIETVALVLGCGFLGGLISEIIPWKALPTLFGLAGGLFGLSRAVALVRDYFQVKKLLKE